MALRFVVCPFLMAHQEAASVHPKGVGQRPHDTYIAPCEH